MTALVANLNSFGLESIARFFVRLNEARIQRKQVNSTIKELSKLSDRELNDIGISRGDIWWVANEVYFDDLNKVESNRNLKGWV